MLPDAMEDPRAALAPTLLSRASTSYGTSAAPAGLPSFSAWSMSGSQGLSSTTTSRSTVRISMAMASLHHRKVYSRQAHSVRDWCSHKVSARDAAISQAGLCRARQHYRLRTARPPLDWLAHVGPAAGMYTACWCCYSSVFLLTSILCSTLQAVAAPSCVCLR